MGQDLFDDYLHPRIETGYLVSINHFELIIRVLVVRLGLDGLAVWSKHVGRMGRDDVGKDERG